MISMARRFTTLMVVQFGNKDKFLKSLYYIDGQILKRKDQYGDAIFYFEGVPKNI